MIRAIVLAAALLSARLTYAEEPAMPTPAIETYQTFDDYALTYTELGDGPLVILLHGFTANAKLNWFDPGIAQKIADAGYRVVAPDLRGHGASGVPDDPKAWPGSAMARDQIALIKHLGEEPHAIVGYSMGALVTLQVHLLSRQGGRLVLGGIGDSAADEWNRDRNTMFQQIVQEAIDGRDTPGAKVMAARAKASGGELTSYLRALSSRVYTPADLLKTFDVPVLVTTGVDDLDNGSGPALAEIIPGAAYAELTGDHLSAVGDPKLAEVIIAFLDEGR